MVEPGKKATRGASFGTSASALTSASVRPMCVQCRSTLPPAQPIASTSNATVCAILGIMFPPIFAMHMAGEKTTSAGLRDKRDAQELGGDLGTTYFEAARTPRTLLGV